eukprot:1063030-Pelagomonas_calceolata.AAC.1
MNAYLAVQDKQANLRPRLTHGKPAPTVPLLLLSAVAATNVPIKRLGAYVKANNHHISNAPTRGKSQHARKDPTANADTDGESHQSRLRGRGITDRNRHQTLIVRRCCAPRASCAAWLPAGHQAITSDSLISLTKREAAYMDITPLSSDGLGAVRARQQNWEWDDFILALWGCQVSDLAASPPEMINLVRTCKGTQNAHQEQKSLSAGTQHYVWP